MSVPVKYTYEELVSFYKPSLPPSNFENFGPVKLEDPFSILSPEPLVSKKAPVVRKQKTVTQAVNSSTPIHTNTVVPTPEQPSVQTPVYVQDAVRIMPPVTYQPDYITFPQIQNDSATGFSENPDVIHLQPTQEDTVSPPTVVQFDELVQKRNKAKEAHKEPSFNKPLVAKIAKNLPQNPVHSKPLGKTQRPSEEISFSALITDSAPSKTKKNVTEVNTVPSVPAKTTEAPTFNAALVQPASIETVVVPEPAPVSTPAQAAPTKGVFEAILEDEKKATQKKKTKAPAPVKAPVHIQAPSFEALLDTKQVSNTPSFEALLNAKQVSSPSFDDILNAEKKNVHTKPNSAPAKPVIQAASFAAAPVQVKGPSFEALLNKEMSVQPEKPKKDASKKKTKGSKFVQYEAPPEPTFKSLAAKNSNTPSFDAILAEASPKPAQKEKKVKGNKFVPYEAPLPEKATVIPQVPQHVQSPSFEALLNKDKVTKPPSTKKVSKKSKFVPFQEEVPAQQPPQSYTPPSDKVDFSKLLEQQAPAQQDIKAKPATKKLKKAKAVPFNFEEPTKNDVRAPLPQKEVVDFGSLLSSQTAQVQPTNSTQPAKPEPVGEKKAVQFSKKTKGKKVIASLGLNFAPQSFEDLLSAPAISQKPKEVQNNENVPSFSDLLSQEKKSTQTKTVQTNSVSAQITKARNQKSFEELLREEEYLSKGPQQTLTSSKPKERVNDEDVFWNENDEAHSFSAYSNRDIAMANEQKKDIQKRAEERTKVDPKLAWLKQTISDTFGNDEVTSENISQGIKDKSKSAFINILNSYFEERDKVVQIADKYFYRFK